VKLILYILLSFTSFVLFLYLFFTHSDHWALGALAFNLGVARALEVEVKRYQVRRGLR